jgi:hypothetical protein
MQERKVINLYEKFKDINKKLKIVCDWDEVVMAAEPYCLWLTLEEKMKQSNFLSLPPFPTFFKKFWSKGEDNWWEMDYDHWGVGLKFNHWKKKDGILPVNNEWELKCPSDFYQQTSFLTIAEDLVKLIKEDKVEKLIFLTANSGESKFKIFEETFLVLASKYRIDISLRIMSEERKKKPYPQNKTEWVKQNASDFDVFIDDNPNICRSVAKIKEKELAGCANCDGIDCPVCGSERPRVVAPHYPAIEKQHDESVLLVRQEVSNLSKKDFEKNGK